MVEVRMIFEFRYKQIGRKIAYYRKLRNLTQEQLAQKINISKSSLGKIECGHYNHSISLSILMAIADGLKIDLDLLIKVDKFFFSVTKIELTEIHEPVYVTICKNLIQILH